MRAIIVGGGEVGTELARLLAREQQDVVLVESNPEVVRRVQDHLDVLTLEGNGASLKTLQRAGVREAELLIATTEVDEVNIMACLIAKNCGVPRTVARIRNPEYVNNGQNNLSSRHLGVDLVINPERVAALEISKLIKTPAVSEVEYFADGLVQMAVFRVEPGSELVGRPIRLLPLSSSCLISAISRENGDVLIPGGDDVINPHDHVYVMGRRGTLTDIGWLARRREERADNVMILGGGRIGFQVAQMMERYRRFGLSIKLVEKNQDRCRYLAEELSGTLVLNADATDLTFLREEDIADVDVLVAVTGDDNTNIVTALLGKKLGARRTIVEVSRADYGPVVKSLGIDSAVSPRLLTAGEILRLVRKGRILSVTILEEDKAEIMELMVSPGARVVGRKLKDARLPRGVLVGAVVREGQVVTPRGDDVLESGDRVIVFALPDAAPGAAQFFA